MDNIEELRKKNNEILSNSIACYQKNLIKKQKEQIIVEEWLKLIYNTLDLYSSYNLTEIYYIIRNYIEKNNPDKFNINTLRQNQDLVIRTIPFDKDFEFFII